MSLTARLGSFASRLGERIPAANVSRARPLIGILALLRAVEAYGILERLRAPGTLRLPLVDWAPDLGPDLDPVVLGAWVLAAAIFGAGALLPYSGLLLTTAMAYVLVLDQQTYSNHLYLLCLVVLLLSFAEATRRRAEGDRGDPASTVARWPVTLLRLQLSLVYIFAATAKLNPVYLSGAVVCGSLGSWVAAIASGLDAALCRLLASLSIVTELFLAAAFWLIPLRLLGWIVGLLFHLLMVVSLGDPVRLQLVIFAGIMVGLYLMFGTPTEAWRALRPRAGPHAPDAERPGA